MGCLPSRTIDKVRIKHSKGSTIGDDNPTFCPDDQRNNSPASDNNNGDIRGKGEAVCNGKGTKTKITINSLPSTLRDLTRTDKPTTGCDQSALLQSQDGYELVNYRGFEESVAIEEEENSHSNQFDGSDDVADSEQIGAQTVSDSEGTSVDIVTNVSGTSTDTSLPAKSTNRDENFPESHGELEDNNKEVTSTEVKDKVGHAHKMEHGEDAMFDEDKPSTSSDLTETDNATAAGAQSALLPSQSGYEDVNYGGCEELIATENSENNTNRINGSNSVADSEQITVQTVSGGEGISDDIEKNVSGTSSDTSLPAETTIRYENCPELNGKFEGKKEEVPSNEVEQKVGRANETKHDEDPMSCGEIPSTFSGPSGTDDRTTGGDQSALLSSQSGYEDVNYGGCEELIATENTENINANRIDGGDDREQVVAQTVSDGEGPGTKEDMITNASCNSTNALLPARSTNVDKNVQESHGELKRLTDSTTNREGAGLNIPYRKMLRDVSDGMKSKDLKDTKFLLRRDPQSLEAAVFPDGVLEKIEDGLDLFVCLERKNFLSSNNLIFLQFILFEIGREDLQNRVAEFASQRGDSLWFYTSNRNEVRGNAYVEFRFQGTLLNFDRISLEEFQEFLENVLGIPKRHINLTELKPGSIVATFQLPITCIGNLQKLIAEKPSSIAYYRVNAVRISNGHWIRLENQEQLAYQTGQDAERAELLVELDRRQKQVMRLQSGLEKAETEVVQLRSKLRQMTAPELAENIIERRYDEVMLPEDLKQEQLSPHKIIGPEVKKTKDEDNAVDNTDTVFLEVNKIMTMQETRTVQNDVLHDGYISLNTEEKDNHRYSTLQNRYSTLQNQYEDLST